MVNLARNFLNCGTVHLFSKEHEIEYCPTESFIILYWTVVSGYEITEMYEEFRTKGDLCKF
jgi:hypothetical protein